LNIFTLLLPSLVSIPPSAVGFGRVLDARVEPDVPSLEDNQDATKSETQTQFDPQVKAVLAKMAAAGIGRPATVADVRKAYLFALKIGRSPASRKSRYPRVHS
jgi:hypothetical protein